MSVKALASITLYNVNDVDSLSVGGRNLLRSTRTFAAPQWVLSSNASISTDDAGYGVVTFAETSSASTKYALHTSKVDGTNLLWSEVCGKEVTLSLEAKSTGSVTSNRGLRVYVRLYSDALKQLYYRIPGLTKAAGGLYNPTDLSSEWQRFSCTFTPTADGLVYQGSTYAWNQNSIATGDLEADGATYFIVDIQNYESADLSVRKPKLEYGSVATDWSPAPEDSASQDDLEAARSELTEQITEQSASLLVTAEGLISEATETLVTTSEFEAYQEEVSSTFTQQADGFTAQITTAKTELSDETDQKIANATSTSITYSANGYLDLYAVTVRFVDESGNPISYWDGDTLHTGNIYVNTTERAQFGNFAFQPRSDGSLMLVKVGG